MFKSISKYTYFSFIPFFILGTVAVVLLILKIIPAYYLLFTLVSWVLISGLGVAAGYHRIFSHKNYAVMPIWKENIILFFGALSGQGSSITWTAIHRGYHHLHTDTEKDLHSPIHGKWYAFFTWATKITEENLVINMKYAVDLLRKPNHVWFHKNQLIILWTTPLIIALVDWKLSLMLCCLPTAISLLSDNLVNVYGHTKNMFGYRNYNTNDLSQNNLILGYLGWGQGWHNNHHAHPAGYDFGTGISGKWWEWDPCRIFIPFLK